MTYTVSNLGQEFIRNYETGEDVNGNLLPQGEPALTAYRDDVGILTIGWGHTGSDVFEGQTITFQRAEELFANDLAIVVQGTLDRLFIEHRARDFVLTQEQVDAVASLIFNIGPTNFSDSGAETALIEGNFDRYLIEMSEFRAGGGNILSGLEDRRADEAELFTQNDYNRTFDSINGLAGAVGNPYAPGNFGGSRDNPSGIPAEWVIGDQNRECFPAHTPITLADQTTKPISEITIGDRILSYDKDGNLVKGVVDKLFRNTTQEWINLSFADGRDDLVATPGHHFLTETGDFMEIGHMVRLGGGSVRLVEKDGSIIEAKADLITYSTETAHLFEEAQSRATIYGGNLAVKQKATGSLQSRI